MTVRTDGSLLSNNLIDIILALDWSVIVIISINRSFIP